MSGFSAEWLSLREPVDHAARSEALTQSVLQRLPTHQAITILDLAAGTGSNFRYLSSRCANSPLVPSWQWLLVDHDSELLARVRPEPTVETRCMDLSTLEDAAIFEGRALVTGSALLDLVSES